jgi:hypothetical protein
MRVLALTGRTLAATIAIALLADCAAGQSARAVPASAQSVDDFATRAGHLEVVARAGLRLRGRSGLPRLRPDGGGTTVWVTDIAENEVYECMEDCKPTGSLDPGSGSWSEPQGIAADAKGNVFVADTLNSRIVELSRTGRTVAILDDSGEFPVGVAVAVDGTVGVTNIHNTSYGPGDIVFYAPGSTSPTSAASGVLSAYYFCAFDSEGNFYNDGLDSDDNVHVAILPKGETTDYDTGIAGTEFPGGVEVGKSRIGKVGVGLNVDDQDCPCIREYGLTGGYPLLNTIPLSGASDPVSFGFVKRDRLLWTADAGAQVANEYDYPSGGSSIAVLGSGTFSEPIGAVAVPAGQY